MCISMFSLIGRLVQLLQAKVHVKDSADVGRPDGMCVPYRIRYVFANLNISLPELNTCIPRNSYIETSNQTTF